MEKIHVGEELSLRETQLASLDVLRKIDAVCKAEGLSYWLMFGSLIGAVRHRGFIPWDDDLDIAMSREDYERFLKVFDGAKELSGLVAVKPGLGMNRPFLITRVSNPEYKMIGEYGDLVDELGVFVDVYPLDGLGSDMKQAIVHKTKAYRALIGYLQANNFEYNNRNNGKLKRATKAILSMLRGEPEKYQKELEEICIKYSYNSSELVSVLQWTMTPDKSIYERAWFDSTEYLPFEDMVVPVPGGYDQLLRVDYGDYMRLPPEEERVGHHYYSIARRISD